MSLQNLKKENNYRLYIGELVTPGLDLDSISTNSINSLENGTNVFTLPTAVSGNETVVNTDLVTESDLAHSLGDINKGFRNVFCQNLAGLSGPVSVQYGVQGKFNEPPPGQPPLPPDPLIVFESGLKFVNPSNTSDNSILNYYREFTPNEADPLVLTGGYAGSNNAVVAGSTFNVDYSIVKVGSLVNVSITFPYTTAAPPVGVPPVLLDRIIISGLPLGLRPLRPQFAFCPVNINDTINNGIISINTNGTIAIYPTPKIGNVTYIYSQEGGILFSGSVAGSCLSFSYVTI